MPYRQACSFCEVLILNQIFQLFELAILTPAGVYVGCMYQEYLDVQVGATAKVAPQAVVGSGLSFMVGRLSYTFNFTGPCVSTDTACSSSLVSTHLACKVGHHHMQAW